MPITLAWNAADDPSVSGYALYYGLVDQPATNRVDSGANTTATLFGLRANAEYRIYAVSYSANGLESIPSNELRLTPPAVSRLTLSPQSDGSMRLAGKAAPETVCSIMFTPTLHPTAWQTLAQTTADQVGNFAALDVSAGQAKQRFYRVVLGVQPVHGNDGSSVGVQ